MYIFSVLFCPYFFTNSNRAWFYYGYYTWGNCSGVNRISYFSTTLDNRLKSNARSRQRKFMEKINELHFHEILDRSNIFCQMIDDYLIDHPGMTDEMNNKYTRRLWEANV